MYFTAGVDVTVPVEFKVDGEFVVPTAGSVTYTLKGNDGSNILTNQPVETDANTTQIAIVVQAAHNAKVDTVEQRFLLVTFTYNNQTYQVRRFYSLIDFLLYTCSEADVRAFIGVSEYELPDPDIDLVKAYYKVLDDYENLATALTDSSLRRSANDAIKLAAVIDVIPSLQLRVLQLDKGGDKQYMRLQTIDFDQLRTDAITRYSDAVRELNGALETILPLLQIVTPTDVITGT